MSLQNYRRNYPSGVYAGSNPGNGSVRYQCKFFNNAIHEGWPLEFVRLSLDLASSPKERKQRIEDHEVKKKFSDGKGKRSGKQKDSELIEFEEVDVQLRSTHHPQYCLQVNNFLPRLHELRNNFDNVSVLRRHVCPTDPRFDVIDEAIPQLLLLPSLQDSWAIALLVQFTTARNSLSGVQTDSCFMDSACQDFGNRSGNHIMKSEMPFGATFEGIPLPAECFTNHTFPQLCDVCPNFTIFIQVTVAPGSCVTT
jgi:hypothetical protein